jgi:hypothetical protein
MPRLIGHALLAVLLIFSTVSAARVPLLVAFADGQTPCAEMAGDSHDDCPCCPAGTTMLDCANVCAAVPMIDSRVATAALASPDFTTPPRHTRGMSLARTLPPTRPPIS